ncbi:MAG: PKD domain-containing protein [Persicimonas sp.]
MTNRSIFIPVILAALAAVAMLGSGCVELPGNASCTSDQDCRDGRICSETIGACVEPPAAPDGGPDTGPDVPVDPQPRIAAQPASLVFERIDDADPSWRRSWLKTTVRNVGDAPLVIDGVGHTGGDAFELTYSDESTDTWLSDPAAIPNPLGPGDSFDIRAWYETETTTPVSGHIFIESNDPRGEFHIPMSADGSPPCVEVTSGEYLYFTPRGTNEPVTKEVTLRNCSADSSLAIRAVRLVHDGGGAFYVRQESLPARLPEYSALVAPGESASVELIYDGARQEWNAGELLIETNVPDRRSIRIGLYRQTDENDCPIATAGARLSEGAPFVRSLDAALEQSIELSGRASTDPDGDIETYQWSIVDKPYGSSQRIRPDENARDAQFHIDRPGRYAFELQVWDDEGETSCHGADRVDVIARHESRELRVELDWYAPADPDPVDEVGANLDVHYLHPSGRWGQAPWDVFSGNPNPDWSRPNRPDESPELDADVTNGAGIERITHATPEANLAFRTGVHYVDDAGFGTSLATARIYVGDMLLYEARDQALEEDQFWEVAQIVYPGPDVTIVDEVFEEMPEE